MAEGYSVAVVWECALRLDGEACVAKLADFLRKELPPGSFLEIGARGKLIQETFEPGRWD